VQEHDVALCLSVAEREAAERQVPVRDYAAVLLVHAFLHACGLDHERSEAEAEKMAEAERSALQRCGFTAVGL
jgi:probable rRNA maturation factor